MHKFQATKLVIKQIEIIWNGKVYQAPSIFLYTFFDEFLNSRPIFWC